MTDVGRQRPVTTGAGEPTEDPSALPPDLPVPVDDGAAKHLRGRRMPSLTLAATSGESIPMDNLGPGLTILYLYPMTGRPGQSLPSGWDAIPGARGCTPEACGFRDHHAELLAAGVSRVYGISAQLKEEQLEAVTRLRLPYPLLSDHALQLADALALPTFTVDDLRLYKRITLVIEAGRVNHVFYPVFPPDTHAAEVCRWLDEQNQNTEMR